MQKYNTAITRMIFWTQTDLVALFYNSSVVSNGLWDVKSRSLCRYFNPSHQPLLLSSAWWSMNPHPLYTPGRWTIWLRFSPHTPPWCAHTVTSAWMTVPGLFLEWASILPSIVSSNLSSSVLAPLSPRAHSTLHWHPWRQWSYSLSLFACLISKETVNSLRERWSLHTWVPSDQQGLSKCFLHSWMKPAFWDFTGVLA